MAKPSCSNTDGYSSPMPFIGLYIAGASLVCLILMLCDMLSGLRHKTRYMPCRFFSLNSVTLTLLAIASKLPVDLTTYMPSARDQLSKLTGTTMMCICIGFTMPSLAVNQESESITNMAALSILVVTIMVNISIQLATGVIFSFFVEHIIILCCMLMMLFVLWFSTLDINRTKALLGNKNKDLFVKSEDRSLVHRVKRWYIYSCIYNPQLVLCRDFLGLTIGVICIFCSLVLSQATLRSLVFHNIEFCEGVSDYRWSMWMIIITQIVGVIIGSLSVAFRWVTLIGKGDVLGESYTDVEFEDFKIYFSFMKRRSIKTSIMVFSRVSLKLGLMVIFLFIFFIFMFVPFVIFYLLCMVNEKFVCSASVTDEDVSIDSWKEVFKDVGFDDKDELPSWMIMICVKDINKWMNAKRNFSSYLVRMLSRPNLSTRILLNKLQTFGTSHSNGYKVTCLSLVILVKITAISIPSFLTESLRCTLDEAFKMLYFIDEKINVGDLEDPRKRELAKLLWTGGDIHLSENDLMHSHGSVSYAISKVKGACEIFPGELIPIELKTIRDLILDREFSSIEELVDYIEQVFAEMLHFFLAQLPNCIFKEVNECPIEDCEERARIVSRFLCEFDPSMEDKVQWSFPEGTGVTCLLDSQR